MIPLSERVAASVDWLGTGFDAARALVRTSRFLNSTLREGLWLSELIRLFARGLRSN